MDPEDVNMIRVLQVASPTQSLSNALTLSVYQMRQLRETFKSNLMPPGYTVILITPPP